MSAYNEYVGKVIKEARERLRYKQWEVAEKVGITRSAYSQYEIGKNAISMETWLKIAQVLELDAYQVMKDAQAFATK